MKRRKLSAAARSRIELIQNFKYGANGVVSPHAAPADATSPPATSGGGGYQPSPYTPDADETVVCPNCDKKNSPDAVFCDQCGFKLEGAENVDTQGDAPATGDGTDASAAGGNGVPPAPAPGAPPGQTGDGENVDNGVVCANQDCGHLAVEHVNTDSGENTGACGVEGCSCLAMEVENDPTNGAPDPSGMAAAMVPVEEVAPASPPVAQPEPGASGSEDLNKPPQVEGGESMGPAFTIPVAIIEGQPTGDGRQIAPGALTWRTPPLPLMGLATETHDPEGWDLNDPAVICGRIDSFERIPGESGTQLIQARGYYLPNDDGMYFAELNEAMGRLGVSADVAVEATEIQIGELDDDGWPLDMAEMLTAGVIMGLTVCPYPAFEGAYVVLGDGTEAPEAEEIPQQAEAPEVPSAPPASVTAGGQLIHFVAYEECEPCDRGIEVVTASSAPTKPPRAWFSDPGFVPGDGRLVEILDRRGQRVVGGKYACPITVEENGRVFGHIAPWDICHTGMGGQCIIAPRSQADYAHFKRGQHIVTAEGDRIRVGVLTADTGHAPTRGVSAISAMAHYDNTALACADVNIGEDEFGIWVAGALRPDATEDQIRKLTAASISGDWRHIGGSLELVAALAVNQPGFPLAVVAAGHVESLVAAGSSVMYRLKHPAPAPPSGDVALRAALAPMLQDAKSRAKDRIAAALR